MYTPARLEKGVGGMQKTRIILGTYNHIPEGAGESDFESAYQVCWRPFLSVLYRFPEISAALHYSGTVLIWLEKRHPEFLMLLDEMSLRKQIEILGGAFFAPLMPVIPGSDRLGQIEMLTTFLRKTFNKKPHGFWLQDYAWESSMPSVLKACGFDYTFLMEGHFRQTGVAAGDLDAPFLTEDQGRSIAVFPVYDATESLPSPMPVEKAIDWILKEAGDCPLVSIMYDGNSVAELWTLSGLESPDVLFERSFAALQKNALVYETTLPARHFKSMKHFRKAYFPSCSSLALSRAASGGVSLPARISPDPEAFGISLSPPIRSNARSILVADETAGRLYAKMQYVRILVGQLRGDKSRKKTAQEELWRGQCGAAYWCGQEGGIRNPGIRGRAFSALLEAEKITRPHGYSSEGLIRTDLDFDGEKELLFQGGDTNVYAHLRGGAVFELDSLSSCTNYVNSAPAAGGESVACCLDRIYSRREGGRDEGSFATSHYSLQDQAKPGKSAILGREGWWIKDSRRHSLAIHKTYGFASTGFSLGYEIENRESENLHFFFSSEFNLSPGIRPDAFRLFALDGRESRQFPGDTIFHGENSTGFRTENDSLGESLEIRSDTPFLLSCMPIYADFSQIISTPNYSSFQGCKILPIWEISLEAGASRHFSLTVEIKAL
jgi:alpha-amylase